MVNSLEFFKEKVNRRTFGEHLTSTDIFLKFIFPEIKDRLKQHIWVDLYSGEGNLILPILNHVPESERISFFEKHVYLFDVQPKLVEMSIKNALNYNIPQEIAEKNILLRDNLESFPTVLKKKGLPIFHVTNPPYLYLGYIRKHEETQRYLKLFEGENKGYQDLYQIAMINDLRNEVNNLVYIIPSNFMFGASVSNKFRMDLLKHYSIAKMFIFETKKFEFTGTNICIGFFERKKNPKTESLEFMAEKFKKQDIISKKQYILKPEFKYRAGSEFDEFLQRYRAKKPLTVKYYLQREEVNNNKGKNEIRVIDANKYENNEYKKLTLSVNEDLKQKVLSNMLYVRTVDTGSLNGRVGLGTIKEDFNVQGIYVSTNTYRTHPIQIFLEPELSLEDQVLLLNYFNFILEAFRERLDSEFLTTYKYSDAEYTRKYLGLTQVRKLIETFPIINLNEKSKVELGLLIENHELHDVLNLIDEFL